MINVSLTDECRKLLTEFGIDEGLVSLAINQRNASLTDRAFSIIYAIHWLDDSRALFVYGQITEKEIEPKRVKVKNVNARLALKLITELPSGKIAKDADMETILAVVAESFGAPVRCHPNEPYSTLYSGPATFDPNNSRNAFIGLLGNEVGVDALLAGSFRPSEGYAQFVWAFILERYRQWLAVPG